MIALILLMFPNPMYVLKQCLVETERGSHYYRFVADLSCSNRAVESTWNAGGFASRSVCRLSCVDRLYSEIATDGETHSQTREREWSSYDFGPIIAPRINLAL